EGQHGYAVVPGDERDADDEEVGAGTAAGGKDASKGDRYDEQVDQKHVGRKEPHRLGYVTFVRIFDHHDVELPRQQHDRPHGHEQHGEGRDVTRLAPGAAKGEEAGEQLGLRRLEAGEDVAEAVEELVGHKQADDKHAHQLDQRFEGHGGDQPLVAFRGDQPAGAEYDAEYGQDQGQ